LDLLEQEKHWQLVNSITLLCCIYHLAEATAKELSVYDASLISISASDIKGRFVGESEKSLSMLFQVARNLTKKSARGKFGEKPCIIFIDEIDGSNLTLSILTFGI
jgi:AAA+ superfamily predicted ATPase